MKSDGIYVAHSIAGSPLCEGLLTATELKTESGTYLVLANSFRKLRIEYVPNQSNDPWKLLQNHPRGDYCRDHWVPLDEFSSFRLVYANARRLLLTR